MKSKSITIVTSYPLHDEPVVRNRLTPLIQEATNRELYITLISPDTKQFDICGTRHFQHIPVVIPLRSNTSFMKRGLFEWINAIKLINVAKKQNTDFIFITIPSMFLLFCSLKIKREKLLLDVRDLSWEYLSSSKRPIRFIKKAFTLIAKFTLQRAMIVTVTNDTELKKALTQYKISKNRLMKLSNGISSKQFQSLSTATATDAKARPFTVSYIGNIGLAQNLITLIDAAKKLQNFRFFIVGSGTDYNRIQRYIDSNELKNVILLGRIPWEKTPLIYANSDVLYAQLTKDFSGAMPSKLYEYLSTGKHIIYGGGGQAKETLEKFENKTIIPAENASLLISVLKEIKENEYHLTLSLKNRNCIQEQFLRETHIAIFLKKLEELTNSE